MKIKMKKKVAVLMIISLVVLASTAFRSLAEDGDYYGDGDSYVGGESGNFEIDPYTYADYDSYVGGESGNFEIDGSYSGQIGQTGDESNAQGMQEVSGVMDDQGRPVVQNEGIYGFVNNDGEFVPYDYNAYGNTFFDSTTGQQMAYSPSGNGFYNVQFDSSGNAYVMGDDGKTKWTWNSSGDLVTADDKGNKFTLDANGNVVDSNGNIMSSAEFVQTGPSVITQKSLLTGSSGLQMGNSGYTTGSGSSLSSGIGNYISSLLGGGSSSSTGYGTSYGTGSYASSGYSTSGSSYGTSTSGSSSSLSGIGLPSGTIQGVVATFLMWLLGIFGLLAIISFLISGIMYFSAAGNKEDAEKAKKQMEWSILGVIIGLGGLIIVQSVTTWFSGNSFF